VESGLLLDVIVGKSATILKLLSSEDKSLLVWWDALLVLDLLLHVLDSVGRFHIEGNGLSSQGLDENLHSSSKAENQMESRFLLDVVVRKGSAVFELLSGEDEALLIWGDSFLVLDLLLHILDGIGALDVESDGLSSQSLDENLHSSSKAENQVEGGFLLDVVVRESTAILELLSGEDKSLLVWGNSFLVLDFLLHVLDGVGRFDIEGDGLSGKGLDENLHCCKELQVLKYNNEFVLQGGCCFWF